MSRYVAKLFRKLTKPSFDYIKAIKQKTRDDCLVEKHIILPAALTVHFVLNNMILVFGSIGMLILTLQLKASFDAHVNRKKRRIEILKKELEERKYKAI